MGVVVVSSEIAAPIAVVFEFHRDPRGAARVAPFGQRVLTVEGPIPVQQGDEVAFRVRQWPWPIAQRWRVVIERLEDPGALVDRAIESPFRAWNHEHLFSQTAPGRTSMTDRIAYELPFGALGRVADRVFVRRLLLAAFRQRHRRTRRELER